MKPLLRIATLLIPLIAMPADAAAWFIRVMTADEKPMQVECLDGTVIKYRDDALVIFTPDHSDDPSQDIKNPELPDEAEQPEIPEAPDSIAILEDSDDPDNPESPENPEEPESPDDPEEEPAGTELIFPIPTLRNFFYTLEPLPDIDDFTLAPVEQLDDAVTVAVRDDTLIITNAVIPDTIRVVSIHGLTLISQSVTGPTVMIDLRSLPAGAYVATSESGTIKFIKR